LRCTEGFFVAAYIEKNWQGVLGERNNGQVGLFLDSIYNTHV